MNTPMIIAIDFDNTLFKTEWPEIVEPIWHTIQMAKKKKSEGYKLILWTCRHDERLRDAVAACREVGLEFDAVNENLPEIIEAFDGDTRKIFAHEYWDDLSINPTKNFDLTDMQKIWLSNLLTNEATESEGAASSEHLWAIGSDTVEEAAIHEGSAEELREYSKLLRRIKDSIESGCACYEDI